MDVLWIFLKGHKLTEKSNDENYLLRLCPCLYFGEYIVRPRDRRDYINSNKLSNMQYISYPFSYWVIENEEQSLNKTKKFPLITMNTFTIDYKYRIFYSCWVVSCKAVQLIFFLKNYQDFNSLLFFYAIISWKFIAYESFWHYLPWKMPRIGNWFQTSVRHWKSFFKHWIDYSDLDYLKFSQSFWNDF